MSDIEKILEQEICLANEKMSDAISALKAASDNVRALTAKAEDKKTAYKTDCVAGELYYAMQKIQYVARKLDEAVKDLK